MPPKQWKAIGVSKAFSAGQTFNKLADSYLNISRGLFKPFPINHFLHSVPSPSSLLNVDCLLLIYGRVCQSDYYIFLLRILFVGFNQQLPQMFFLILWKEKRHSNKLMRFVSGTQR